MAMTQTKTKELNLPKELLPSTKTLEAPRAPLSDEAALPLIKRLEEVMDRMGAVLIEENELLEARNFAEVAANTEKKREVVVLYEKILKEISEQKDILINMSDKALKAKLLAKAETFSDHLRKNHIALQSVHISARRVADRLTGAVRNKLKEDRTDTYNAKGTLNSALPNAAAMTDGAY